MRKVSFISLDVNDKFFYEDKMWIKCDTIGYNARTINGSLTAYFGEYVYVEVE